MENKVSCKGSRFDILINDSCNWLTSPTIIISSSIKGLIPAGLLAESKSEMDDDPLTSAIRSEINLLVTSVEEGLGERGREAILRLEKDVDGVVKGRLEEDSGSRGVLNVSVEVRLAEFSSTNS